MHDHSISITLDEAFARLEEILDFHAPVSGVDDKTGLYEFSRSFRVLRKDADGASVYGTGYKVAANVPSEWATVDAERPWISVVAEDLIDALDQLANLVVDAAPVAA